MQGLILFSQGFRCLDLSVVLISFLSTRGQGPDLRPGMGSSLKDFLEP